MLKSEEAEKIIAKQRKGDAKLKLSQRISDLPENLRIMARGLMYRDADGKEFKSDQWQKRNEAYNDARQKVNALNAADRLQLFQAFFPRLADDVEAAWQLLDRLPYQDNYDRVAFRAPCAAGITHQRRDQLLTSAVHYLTEYDVDTVWLAEYAAYFGYGSDWLGYLFAGVIDRGDEIGDKVFDILIESANGTHPIGATGRHVFRALLCASRPDGWEFCEKYLLAAQRNEGLRQVVLESIDEAHPEAFRRMLRLIIEHDLARFSATVRAVDVWFGFGFEAGNVKPLYKLLSSVLGCLEEPETRQQALNGSIGKEIYLALWTAGFENVLDGIELAKPLLSRPEPEVRFAAAYFLSKTGICAGIRLLLPLLDDPDLRIAALVVPHIRSTSHSDDDPDVIGCDGDETFDVLERNLPRFPKTAQELTSPLWDWHKIGVERSDLADLMPQHLGSRPVTRLKPYLPDMDSWRRRTVCDLLAERNAKDWTPDEREMVFGFLKDASSDVRAQAFKALDKTNIEGAEMQAVEGLLTRKSSDVRQGAIKLLLRQNDTDSLASVERLTASKQAEQRTAGLEMARQMLKKKRASDKVRGTIEAYSERVAKRTEQEQKLVEELLDVERVEVSLSNALGMMEGLERSPVVRPQVVAGFRSEYPKAKEVLKSLQVLFDSHKQTEIPLKQWNGDVETKLLGDVHYWAFPYAPNEINAETRETMPLLEVWEKWADELPQHFPDMDRWDLYRVIMGHEQRKYREYNQIWFMDRIFDWLMRLRLPADAIDFLLDGAETQLAQITYKQLKSKPRDSWREGWREKHTHWLNLAKKHRTWFPDAWTPAHYARLWKLTRWLEEPFAAPPPETQPQAEGIGGKLLSGIKKAAQQLSQALGSETQESPEPEEDSQTPESEDEKGLTDNRKLSLKWSAPAIEVAYGLAAGAATQGDVIWNLIGERPKDNYGRDSSEMGMLTTKQGETIYTIAPQMRELVMKCRDRIVEIELGRGDLPTAVSSIVLNLGHSGGADVLLRAVKALGKTPFQRSGWYWYSYSDNITRAASLSHLVRTSKPAEGETPEAVAAKFRDAGLSDQRLVEIAVFAPQWSKHVQAALGWEMLYEAIWWLNAHTKDAQWEANAEVKEMWGAEAASYTPLTGQNLLDGAVDVAWFRRVYQGLGEERWTVLDNAAKYASGGGGHKRAQLFADAMLGRISKAEVITRIKDKRNQDSVRALGLLPLDPLDSAEVLDRYKTLQEFVRTSKQFGAQRQASEKLAASISMENLARTAGYPDPLRLEWAMEREAVADLAQGPVSVTNGETTVTLSINALGMPEVSAEKAGKALKAVPQALKKDAEIAALTARKTEIERQARRMRESLEQAMIRGDEFTGRELQTLLEHPVLAPMLRNLVFVGANGLAGYPADGGFRLEAHDGTTQNVAGNALLRVAHPYDLLQTGAWSEWQRDCFLRERVQPFKQVFRELYVPTETESDDGTLSRRYAGHQINARQGVAILSKRGWVNAPEEGLRRTYHAENLAVYIEFNQYFTTPAEVEGLTVETVRFTRRNEWLPLKLEDIPPRVFSEAMRDVDLLVSVAHQGGIDPEASASTIEMRQSILRETCRLLKIENVRLEAKHALIDGKLANYSVHLGSAAVHQQPGGYVCIVPVHGQHRGRLFLPFADDDPRTAECVSKVLLLAKDDEIKDPTVLEQILRK
jgi:hypothetical protein